MRRKIVTIAAAGVLGVSGIAVAGPVLAASGATGAAAAVTSRVDAIKSALSGLVKDGTLTQAQADKVATTLDKAGPKAGIGPRGFGPGGRFGHGPGGDLGTAATTLKLTEAQLRTALESGKSLAAIAKTQKVPVQTLIAALVKAERRQIEAAVTAGRLTRAEADRILTGITARVTDRVNNARPWGHRHGFDGGPGPGAAPGAPGAPAPSTSSAPAAPAPTQTS